MSIYNGAGKIDRHAVIQPLGHGHLPSFEEGTLRPINKMLRYLRQGAAGEVRHTHKSDLPRHAEAKEAWHLIDRRGDPSSKEGIVPRP